MFACSQSCRHQLRIFLFAANATCSRIAARYDLSENSQIRNHIKVSLRAGKSHAEPCYHLIENHQCAVFIAKLPHALIIVSRYRASTALRTYRFYDDSRCTALFAIPLEHLLQHFQIVRTDFIGQLIRSPRDSVRFQQRPASRDLKTVYHLIRPAMISPSDLDDPLVIRRDPCNTQRCHNRLCAGTQHAEHLHVRHVLIDFLSDEHFRFVKQSGHRAAGIEQVDDLLPYYWIVAAQDGRTARLQEVDIFVTVLIV